MAELWVTIPSRGRDTLAGAIGTCGVARDRIVVVDTSGTVRADGCHVVRDEGPVNIQRWWNVGLDFAQARGATHVAVLNDDIRLGPTSLPLLLDALIASGAAISTPGDTGLTTDPNPRRRRTLDGPCWVLDLSTGLRPDEGYRWWYGDDDLDLRARRDHGGVMAIPVPFLHLHPNGYTNADPFLLSLALADADRWTESTMRGVA